MPPAENAFRLAFGPAKVGGRLGRERVCDKFADDPDAAVQEAVASARRVMRHALGTAPTLRSFPAAWLQSRSAIAAEARPSLADPVVAAAFAAGDACCDLELATKTLDVVMRLRAAAPGHEGLRAEARAWCGDLSAAHAMLEAALAPVRERPAVNAAAGRVHAAVGAVLAAAAAAPAEERQAVEAGWRALHTAIVELQESFDVPLEPPVTGPATREELDLVAAIVAAPDDDALRLRFAEVAGRRHEPRAELVRAQHAGDKTRVRQLVRLHPEWTEELSALGATEVVFRLGFADAITIDAARLFECADAIFRRAPVRRLRVEGGAPGLGARLAALRWLGQLRALSLWNCGLVDADVAALASSPFVTRLRYLGLAQNAITDRGASALAASETLRGLVACSLSDNPCADPVDTDRLYDETNYEWIPTDAGRALEAKYGRLAWLHPPPGGWYLGFDDF